MGYKFGVLIPTYGHFEYAARAIQSCFDHTPDAAVLILDDASPELEPGVAPTPIQKFLNDPAYKDRTFWIGFLQNGGLTRSWNTGLYLLRNSPEEYQPEYVVVANSDVLFTPNWTDAIRYQLDNGYDLVGPLSNAPGTTAKGGIQEVQHYLKDYLASDDELYLSMTANTVRQDYCYEATDTPVNGFCMVARLKTWWKYAYEQDCVFRPRNDVNSKGQPNPTPLMTLNEDEFQGRLRAAGGRTGVALGSFVFHYRAVSRGDRYKHGLWYRLDGSHA